MIAALAIALSLLLLVAWRPSISAWTGCTDHLWDEEALELALAGGIPVARSFAAGQRTGHLQLPTLKVGTR
jgi:hypothetical protein